MVQSHARVGWIKAMLVLMGVLWSSLALAQKPVMIHVIALDSDDSSEDQADALTSALRVRVRNAPSLQLAESNQSLATLLPALKCPSRPDSACLQKIGDQLKTDRFFWGTVSKSPVPHQVTAEVHLWTRGRPEQVAKETFSDNLKDQNDDALKRIAAALFEHLTGQATQGTVLVRINGAQVGTVVVDGKPGGAIAAGQATLQLPSGTHAVEVQVDGMTAPPQDVNVVVNVQSELTFDLKPVATAPVVPTKPSHIKKTIGFITLGVAGAAAIAAGIFGGLYPGNLNTWNTYAGGVPTTQGQLCSMPEHAPGSANGISNGDACSARSSAITDGTLAWTFGGAAVGLAIVGIVLVVTDHPDREGPPAARLRVLPTFGPNGGGLSASLTF